MVPMETQKQRLNSQGVMRMNSRTTFRYSLPTVGGVHKAGAMAVSRSAGKNDGNFSASASYARYFIKECLANGHKVLPRRTVVLPFGILVRYMSIEERLKSGKQFMCHACIRPSLQCICI